MNPKAWIAQETRRLTELFGRADRRSGGWLGTLVGAWDAFINARGAHASAAVAYYAMFSLFPLFVALVVLTSYLVDASSAQEAVMTFMGRFLPDEMGVEQLVNEAFAAVFAARGQVGFISLIALLWSASGVFTTLTYHIDLAWTQQRRPNALKARLIGLLLVILLFAALLLALLLSTVLGVVAALPPLFERLDINPEIGRLGAWQALSVAVSFAIYAGLYRWIPRRQAPWRAALAPALLAAIASQVVNAGYTWYLGSQLQAYEVLYGPLSTIVVLMFWFYLRVLIILVGAHLGAAIARRMEVPSDATGS